MADSDLKQTLKLRYGTGPSEPSDEQLRRIRQRLREIQGRRAVTEEDLAKAVSEAVPSAGQYKYASRDDSDVADILDQLIGGS